VAKPLRSRKTPTSTLRWQTVGGSGSKPKGSQFEVTLGVPRLSSRFASEPAGSLRMTIVKRRGCPTLVSPFFGETGWGF
jgi:hypothetical protein